MDINNMNPMMRSMIERAIGTDKFNSLLNQWNKMSPEQKQAEMNKVSGMTPQQRNQYLMSKGVDVSGMGGTQPTQTVATPEPPKNRFNY